MKNAKPKADPYTLADGGSMYLEVKPSGSKIWRMSYRQANGKTNRFTFDAYLAFIPRGINQENRGGFVWAESGPSAIALDANGSF